MADAGRDRTGPRTIVPPGVRTCADRIDVRSIVACRAARGKGKKFGKPLLLYKKYFTFGNKLKRINSSDDALEFSLLEFTLSKH